MKIDQTIVNFTVHEDGTEFCGIAKVTMPDISFLTQSVSGSGIGGNVDAVITGMVDTMSLTLEFRTVTEQALRLTEPRRHNLTLRVAQQYEDTVAARVGIQQVKHVVTVVPKSLKGGSIAPASTADVSGEYAVRYWAMYVNNKKQVEIDPLNFICIIDGIDYLADVRKALGK